MWKHLDFGLDEARSAFHLIWLGCPEGAVTDSDSDYLNILMIIINKNQ